MFEVMICAIMLITIMFAPFCLGIHWTITKVAKNDPKAMELVEKYREAKE